MSLRILAHSTFFRDSGWWSRAAPVLTDRALPTSQPIGIVREITYAKETLQANDVKFAAHHSVTLASSVRSERYAGIGASLLNHVLFLKGFTRSIKGLLVANTAIHAAMNTVIVPQALHARFKMLLFSALGVLLGTLGVLLGTLDVLLGTSLGCTSFLF